MLIPNNFTRLYVHFYYYEPIVITHIRCWTRTGLTVSLHPSKPCHSCPMGKFLFISSHHINSFISSGCNNFSTLAIATLLYNVLDLPTGCIPVTRVDPVKDILTDDWMTGPGHGSPIFEGGIYHGKNSLYNPEATKGMPINIQIVGRKWEDEKVLAIMKVVDEALGKDRGFGPGAWDAYR